MAGDYTTVTQFLSEFFNGIFCFRSQLIISIRDDICMIENLLERSASLCYLRIYTRSHLIDSIFQLIGDLRKMIPRLLQLGLVHPLLSFS